MNKEVEKDYTEDIKSLISEITFLKNLAKIKISELDELVYHINEDESISLNIFYKEKEIEDLKSDIKDMMFKLFVMMVKNIKK